MDIHKRSHHKHQHNSSLSITTRTSLKQLRQEHLDTQKDQIAQKQQVQNELDKILKQMMEKSQEGFVSNQIVKFKKLNLDSETNDFYRQYKSLDRIQQENSLSGENSAFTEILGQSQKQCLLPSKLGLVGRKHLEKIDITSYQMGDKYISVLGDAIKYTPELKMFRLGSNRIGEMGASALLRNMHQNVQVLDLIDNHIGKIGCEYLGGLLNKKECRIEELVLEGNKLGDSNLKIILNSLLEGNRSLKRLNLSKNYITNISASNIKQLLKKTSSLEELYLHWNQIQAQGGEQIFEGLATNDTLFVLDFSWNSLGETRLHSCSQQLAIVLQQNTHLLHLDISNNHFIKEESASISHALSTNHTLYGLHYKGNYGYIDSYGYLQLSIAHDSRDHTRIQGVKQNKNIQRTPGQEIIDICWICEGWTEQDLAWKGQGGSEGGSQDKAKLYCDWNGFATTKLNQEVEQMVMVPPGKNYFYYYVQDQHRVRDDLTKVNKREIELRMEEDLEQLNRLSLEKNKDLFDPSYYTTELTLTPRNSQTTINNLD